VGSLAGGGPATRATTKLPSGVTIVAQEDHAAPVVSLQAWVASGAADDPPDMAGAAHFFEHLVLAGSKRRPAGQMARELESMGGSVRAWTSLDETVYELTVASSFFDRGLDLMADALTAPGFEPAEIERARAAIREEIRQAAHDPARAGAEALFASAFAPHPYGRSVLGSDAAVAGMTRERLTALYLQRYVASNVTLVLVGDFDAAGAAARARAAFAALPAAGAKPERLALPAQAQPRVIARAGQVARAELAVGFRTAGASDRDAPALDLLAAMLGRGERGRLAAELVRNRQLASAVRAYTFTGRAGGLLVVQASGVPASRTDEAARTMLDEILRLGREPAAGDELARARTVVEADLGAEKQTAAGAARRLGLFAVTAGDAALDDAYLVRLRQLGPGDVDVVAARVLRGSGLAVAALVPAGPAARRGGQDPERLSARLAEIAAGADARADARAIHSVPRAASTADVARFLLPSGTRLLVLRDGTGPLVAVEAIWPGGLRNEEPRTSGVSAMIGPLLTRGTKTRSAEELARAAAELGGSISGFAGRNGVGLRAELLAGGWDRGLELVADCLRNPSFPDEELERQRRSQLDEVRGRDEDPERASLRLFAEALFAKHPYRLDPLGTTESVAGLTRRKLVEHFRSRYPLAGLTIAVVGDVDPAQVAAKLQALLAEPAAGAVAPPPPALEPPRAEPSQVFRFIAGERAEAVVGYPGVSLADPDRFALALAAQVLGGPDGRLPALLRDQRALAFNVESRSLEGIDPGSFVVSAACSPAALDAVVDAIRSELARLAASGVSADELERARRYLVGRHAAGLERKSMVAAALAAGEAYGQGFRAYARYAADLARVSREDVQRVARRIFGDAKREVVAVVEPPSETPALAKATAAGKLGGGGAAPAAAAP
jgi:zinc protease